MDTQLVYKITWNDLVDILLDATGYIFISLPSISDELAQCFEKVLDKKDVAIHICVDNSEKIIRDGYGEEQGIKRLLDKGIKINESLGNKVSFIITDNVKFIFFPESKIFSQDPIGPNAISIDPVTSTRLIKSYFPQENKQINEALNKLITSGMKKLEYQKDTIIHQPEIPVAVAFNKEEFKKIEQAIAKNPVEHPDLQRQIKTYTAKVQFVEQQFKGGRIQNTLVKFPEKALPIKDEQFKELLNSRIKLINNESFLDENENIKKLNARVEALRKNFLVPITCREGKSILFKDKKVAFQKELEAIRNDVEELNLDTPQIVRKALDETKVAVKKSLVNYYTENPLDDHKKYEGEQRIKKVTNYVQPIVDLLKPPSLSKLENHYSLLTNYYDLTWEDFKDEELLKEFEKKKVLNEGEIKQIVDMKKGFETKK